MNKYPHHIGDFDKATRHLTRIERSIYRDLIELYYDTESQLTLDFDALCRRIIARSNEERTAVEQTLNEFFIKTATGWFHSRCDDEIGKYHANNSQKAEAGKQSAAKRAMKKQQALNARSTDVGTDGQQTYNGDSTNQSTNQPINQLKEGGKSKSRFSPPLLDAVRAYCIERQNNIDPENFINFYQAKNWMVGKSKMADWQACVRTWEKRNETNKHTGKISNAEHRQNIGRFIEEQAKQAVCELSEGAFSEDASDIPPEMGCAVS